MGKTIIFNFDPKQYSNNLKTKVYLSVLLYIRHELQLTTCVWCTRILHTNAEHCAFACFTQAICVPSACNLRKLAHSTGVLCCKRQDRDCKLNIPTFNSTQQFKCLTKILVLNNYNQTLFSLFKQTWSKTEWVGTNKEYQSTEGQIPQSFVCHVCLVRCWFSKVPCLRNKVAFPGWMQTQWWVMWNDP